MFRDMGIRQFSISLTQEKQEKAENTIMKGIISMGFVRLRNNEVFSLFSRIAELASALLNHEDDAPVLAAYKLALEEYDTALNQEFKFQNTKATREAADRCEKLYGGLKLVVRGMLQHPYIENRLSARRVMALFDKYGKINGLSYNQKYGVLLCFMQELAELHKGTHSLLQLKPWQEALESAIQDFCTSHTAQTTERSIYQVGLVKDTRHKAEIAHRTFVRTINAFAIAFEDEIYTSFINQTNAILIKAKAIAKARAGKSDREEPMPEEPKTEPEEMPTPVQNTDAEGNDFIEKIP